jgi:hypothetical protein
MGLIDGTKQRPFSEAQSREMWSLQTILPVGNLRRRGPLADKLRRLWAWMGPCGTSRTQTGRPRRRATRLCVTGHAHSRDVVVLTNQEAGGLLYSVTLHILDRYTGVADHDWLKGFTELDDKIRTDAAATEKKLAELRPTNSKNHSRFQELPGQRDYDGDILSPISPSCHGTTYELCRPSAGLSGRPRPSPPSRVNL